MHRRKVLITGAHGFLGQHVHKLLAIHECILLVNRLNPERQPPADECFTDTNKLLKAHPKFDIIIHLAAHIPYGRMHQPSDLLTQANISLTEHLASHYPQARWVFSSTVAIYGTNPPRPVTTSALISPDSHYAASKWEAERIIEKLPDRAIIRFSSIIGSGMKPNSLIPIWIQQAQTTRQILIWGKGTRTQNYIDVRDAAKFVHLLAQSSWQGVTLGISPDHYTNVEVAGLIGRKMNAQLVHTIAPDEVGALYEDRSTHDTLGFETEFSISDTIEDMLTR
jgi:nucleoside-diphosphate-sugar epimerase